jgi:hypothetical protein
MGIIGDKMGWKIISIVAFIVVLIILNHIPYTYQEVSTRDSDCRGECWPDSFYSFKENQTYTHTEEIYAWENNALIKKNQTFNENFTSVNCKCQTSLLKKSFSWMLNNRRYE